MDEILVPGEVDGVSASGISHTPSAQGIDLNILSTSSNIISSSTGTILLCNEGETYRSDAIKTCSTSLEKEHVGAVKSLVGDSLTDDVGDETQGE